jgi:hypothetical protein
VLGRPFVQAIGSQRIDSLCYWLNANCRSKSSFKLGNESLVECAVHRMYSYWPSLALSLLDEREPTRDNDAEEENSAAHIRVKVRSEVIPTDAISATPAIATATSGTTQEMQQSADSGIGLGGNWDSDMDKNRELSPHKGMISRASVSCTLQWPDRASVESVFKEPHTFRCNSNVI